MQKKNKPSEGELIIEQFFKDKLIKYVMHPLVNKRERLTDDQKSYREADFYLPNFKMYVEFFGMWNAGTSPEGKNYRQEYNEKKRVYKLNRVPCIYLYPENLGFLEQAIHMRIEEELKSMQMKKELVNFKYYQTDRGLRYSVSIFMILISFLTLWFLRNETTPKFVYLSNYILVILSIFCLAAFIDILNGGFKYLRIYFGSIKD